MSIKQLADSLRIQLNKEYVRRLLIRYFIGKGFDNTFDILINPAIVQDLPAAIPQLASKIEIVPYIDNIQIDTGKIIVGWNLYVLGIMRMYLGTSSHKTMHDLTNLEVHGECHKEVTPKEIIEFITTELSNSEEGIIEPSDTMTNGQLAPMINKPRFGPTSTAGFYEKKPYGR